MRRLLIPILLLALTIFLSSCKTTAHKEYLASVQDWAEAMNALAPPLPVAPEMEQVIFEDRDGGLWLSYNDYRALERNIIALREYSRRLEVIIWFYREGK